MIRTDCTIEHARKPANGDRLCWNVECRKPLTSRARKWCVDCTGDKWWVDHKFWLGRNDLIKSACESGHTHVTGPINIPFYQCKVRCSMCGELTQTPEIDHIEPMNGDDRSVSDCRNHRENLRILDPTCHKKVTRRQAFARAANRRGQGVLINL